MCSHGLYSGENYEMIFFFFVQENIKMIFLRKMVLFFLNVDNIFKTKGLLKKKSIYNYSKATMEEKYSTIFNK